jgi:hypothetical protein
MKMRTATKKSDILKILHGNEDKLREFGVRRYGLFGSFLHDLVSKKATR